MTPWDAKALGRRHPRVPGRLRCGSVRRATWVLSNHDVVRHASRLALTAENPQGEGIGPPNTPNKPDTAIGLAAPRACDHADAGAARIVVPVPGRRARPARGDGDPDEFPPGPDLVPHERRALRTRRYAACRFPGRRMLRPSASTTPACRGSRSRPTGAAYSRDVEEVDPGSTLALYKRLLAARREHGFGTGSLVWEDAGVDAVAFPPRRCARGREPRHHADRAALRRAHHAAEPALRLRRDPRRHRRLVHHGSPGLTGPSGRDSCRSTPREATGIATRNTFDRGTHGQHR